MTTTNQPPLTDEVQRARSILAELAEAGTTLLTRERHLDVLLALDNLERSSRGDWPPPPARREVMQRRRRPARSQGVPGGGPQRPHPARRRRAARRVRHRPRAAGPGAAAVRYGFHHARSTDALAWLLAHDEPVPPEEYPVLLSCRAALLAAHRERCERTVRGADVQVAMFNNRRLGRDLAVLARGGATALGILLDEYPTFPDEAAPFTDVLQMEGLTPQAHAWVEAARHAVLATEAAVTSTSWTERPDQAWQVVADIADSAQAVVRLDARLSATNPAPVPDWAKVLRFPAAELNLTSRHLGYVARSGHLDAAVDATSRVEMHRGLLRVHDLANVVDGARSLARHLTTARLSVPDLRGFAIMHSELCHLGAEALTGTGLEEIQCDYRRREVRFREVAGMTAQGQEPAPPGAVRWRCTRRRSWGGSSHRRYAAATLASLVSWRTSTRSIPTSPRRSPVA